MTYVSLLYFPLFRLTVILIHGKDLDDQVGLVANRDAGEINDELVRETVADVDARHAVALTRHLRHRDVNGVVAVAGGTLAPPAAVAARHSDVVGADPIETETLVVALSHDAHLVWGSLPKVGAGEPALGDLEMVLGRIGPRYAWFCNMFTMKERFRFDNYLKMKVYFFRLSIFGLAL